MTQNGFTKAALDLLLKGKSGLYAECAICPVIAFEPKACSECGPNSGKLCSDCRKECPACNESVCYDHFDDKRGTCTACEGERYVESGEARSDYNDWARGMVSLDAQTYPNLAGIAKHPEAEAADKRSQIV